MRRCLQKSGVFLGVFIMLSAFHFLVFFQNQGLSQREREAHASLSLYAILNRYAFFSRRTLTEQAGAP